MNNLGPNRTLIIGLREGAPVFREHAGVIPLQRVGFISWTCECGASGNGFMPEHHASLECRDEKTLVLPRGFVDGDGI